MNDSAVVEKYNELGTQKKTAEYFGCSRSHIGEVLRRSGVHIGRGEKSRKVDHQDVLRLWNIHKDTGVVAGELGIARAYVSTILKNEFGIVLPKGGLKAKYDLPMDKLAERYLDGETCGDIAVDYGLRPSRIRRRLISHGVEIRSAAESVPRGEKNIFYKDGRSAEREHPKTTAWRHEARCIAEACLGRELPSGWVVHHMDENIQNSQVENLWLFPDHRSHARYHTRRLSRQHRGIAVDATLLALESGGQALLRHPLVLHGHDRDPPAP